MPDIYVGIGSNLGDREANLQKGLREMASSGIEVLAGSAVYESDPVGNTAQPDFLNAVVEVETALDPRALLSLLLDCERVLGRVRGAGYVKWGPRSLDLDLLLYGQAVLEEEGLRVPHPRLHERAFVLLPLCDLNPDGRHPVCKQSYRSLAASLDSGQSLRRVEGVDLLPALR